MVNKLDDKNENGIKSEPLLCGSDEKKTSFQKDAETQQSFQRLEVFPPQSSVDDNSNQTADGMRKCFRNMSHPDDSMTVLVSAFYAKLLIVLGLTFPITTSLQNDMRISFATDVFTLYLYLVSMMFLGYIFYHLHLARKTHKHGKHYGSFYLHMGVAGFSVGSIIYSCLQLGEYYDLVSECRHVMIILRPVIKITFTAAQTVFIFSYTDILDRSKGVVLDRFGVMHLIATNVCEWLNIVIQEAKDDMVSISYGIESYSTRYALINGTQCRVAEMITPIIKTVKPYLRPCGVEYSLLCSIIIAVIWKDLCPERIKHRRDSKVKREFIDRMNNAAGGKPPKHFSVDCSQAHKGLFSGLAVLAGTIVSLLLFNGLVHNPEFIDLALFQSNIWETVLFVITTIASISCLSRIRVLALRANITKMPLEHALLMVMQCGVFLYYFFQVIGASFMLGEFSEHMRPTRIIAPACALIQSAIQTLLIMDAWGRKCSSDQMRTKPGRQIVTFLLVANFALWLLNRVKNLRAEYHLTQMNFYGVSAWTLITHVSVPLVVCYRFQATVCFYEIWKSVYKARKPKKEEYHELNSV